MTRPVTARSSAPNGRPCAAAGRAFGRLPVTFEATDAQLLDLWAARDRLSVTWPPDWTAPDGTTPGAPAPVATPESPPRTPTPPPALAIQIQPHAPRPDARFCCPVGAHPMADAIARELRAGGKANSLRKVADRYKLSKSTVGSHRSTCLGITTSDTTGQPPDTRTTTPDTDDDTDDVSSQESGQVEGQPSDVGQSVAIVAKSAVGVAEPRTRAAQVPRQDSALTKAAQIALEQAQRVAAERVGTIADLVNTCQWKDRETVVGLALVWKIPEDVVQRYHALAAAKLAASRGSRRAVMETSVAHTRRVRDRDAELSEEHAVEAERLAKLPKVNRKLVRMHTQMAAQLRTNALAAQKHLDALLGLIKPGGGPGTMTINVAITTQPDFMAAWAVVSRVLDALYPRTEGNPGAAARTFEGLAVWEDQGDDGLTEWLAEQQRDDGAIVAVGTTT